MAPDSSHEVPLDGFVQPTLSSTAPNQALQLVSQGSHSSGSANVNSVGVSGVNSIGIFPEINSWTGRTCSSNPKSSKKKNAYYHHRSGEKRERLIWTSELHQCFLECYNQLPNEKRVPKTILEEMQKRFPYITRENVASHLQKHRLYLRGLMDKKMGNSAKSSSKSVPRKVSKAESNFHQFYNDTSISTSPNAAHFPHQSHSISTNPTSQFPLLIPSISTDPNPLLPLQSHSISTSPNPRLHLQSHSISTSPNPHLHLQSHSISTSPNYSQLHLQSHSISTSPNSQLPLQSHTLHEPLLNQLLSQFDQTHLLDQDIVHAQFSFDIGRNNVPIHGGGANIYSNMMNVLESQRNPFGVIGQSSNAASDFPIRDNLFPSPIRTNHDQSIFNIDGNGNGFSPIMGNSFGGLSGNDFSLDALPNSVDYNMNLNLDNVQVDGVNNMYPLGSYSDALQFDYPLNFNAANELQLQYFEQALQSIFCPPGNHPVDDASTLPPNFENPREKRDE